jgi:hypothetical protein
LHWLTADLDYEVLPILRDEVLRAIRDAGGVRFLDIRVPSDQLAYSTSFSRLSLSLGWPPTDGYLPSFWSERGLSYLYGPNGLSSKDRTPSMLFS